MFNDKNLKKSFYKFKLINFIYGIKIKIKRAFFSGKVILGKKNLDIDEGNQYIYDKIMEGKPFAIGRYGASELKSVTAWLSDSLGVTKNALEKVVKGRVLYECAGFFPNEKSYHEKYAKLICDLTKEIDANPFYYIPMADFLVKHFAKEDIVFMLPRALEPWYCKKNFWTSALKGKKVLVIHPFAQTIEAQYKKRELIFPENEYLPQFELHTLKAVQTIAGVKDERFSDWFEALEWMYNEALKIDFDVAIIGCGAYGFPLAAMLKKAGKQAVHMAGATQILFGIKGKRWDSHPEVSKLYNEHWVRPEASDIPKDAKKVEGGCYW